MSNPELYVLAYAEPDNSGFKVCGITGEQASAISWMAAGEAGNTSGHRVYKAPLGFINPAGWGLWKPSLDADEPRTDNEKSGQP